MQTQNCLSSWMGRTAALIAVLGAGTALMHAQTSSSNSAPLASGAPSLNLAAPVAAGAAYSSSSSSSDSALPTETASVTTPFNFAGAMNAMQYGGRSRYGRPRYRGGNTNEDGSQKIFAYAGGGFTLPTGATHATNTASWGIQGGVGRNWNKHVGVAVEFDWDNFGLNKATLDNQGNMYNNQITYYNCSQFIDCNNDTNAVPLLTGIDGYSHDWSFSLQPVYNIAVNEGLGAYITGGAGFYHKITTFTTPEAGCDPYALEFYGICEEIAENEPIDSYTSNAPGVDLGLGLTYKFSHFSNEELYAEARYVYTFNQYRPGIDAAACNPSTLGGASSCGGYYTDTNDYPQNSNRTSYIPVKFGIRF